MKNEENEDAARAFAMPDAVKVECRGQDTRPGKRFGARIYRLFATWAAWEYYQKGARRG